MISSWIFARNYWKEKRFDRVVLDKKIDSREAYFRSLNKQVVALEDLNQKIKKTWISYESSSNATQRKGL